MIDVTDGILVVNKPISMTSRDVVNQVGKILQTKKIGHTGTLDPLATGVLVLTIGQATKLTDLITAHQKRYIATAILGIDTDTLDVTGTILKEENCHLSKEKIENVLTSFVGSYEQEVPIYSAVKVNGRKLYEYARNHETVDLPKKIVTIKDIKLLSINQEKDKTIIQFECLVSKGTYIRSLIRDIASKLNTVGCMKNLERITQGKYTLNQAYSLEQIKNNEYKVISLVEVLQNYFTIQVDHDLKFKVVNGQVLLDTYHQDYVLFIDEHPLALYKKVDDKLKPFKMFHF